MGNCNEIWIVIHPDLDHPHGKWTEKSNISFAVGVAAVFQPCIQEVLRSDSV
jgi:hypothetical protein